MSEKQEQKNEDIREFGQVALNNNRENNRISLLTIIGEIEGHDCLPATTKTTKYEHVLPKLAEMEDNRDTEGILLLLNTVGGDVESGLAIAEMIASISKPTVSLVLGGKPFDRRAARCLHGLLVYCPVGHHGDSSRAHERNCHRSQADLRLF